MMGKYRTMPISVFPLIDAREVLRKVGGASFTRGQALVHAEKLVSLEWDEASGVLSGRVGDDDGVDHAASVTLAMEKGAWAVIDSSCASDPEGGCRHCAALLIGSNGRNKAAKAEAEATAANAPVKDSGWKASLERILEAGKGPRGVEAEPEYQPMALQFELQDTRDSSRRQYVPGQGPTHARGVRGRWQLAVRPMVLNGQDRWVRGNLRWNTISFKTYGLALDPEQHRWFCQFVPLYRSNGELYFGEDNDWLLLDDFSSSLIWPLLREANKLGIALIGTGEIASIEIAEDASIGMEATKGADLVIAAVPLHRYRTLDREALAGHAVIDLLNYWAGTDGKIEEFEVPETSSEVIADFLDGARTVKTLNHIGYHEMESDHRPAGDPERRAVALAGNDEDAKVVVSRFLDEIGFDPVDAGDLAAGAAYQPGTPIFNGSFDAAQMRAELEKAAQVPVPQNA